MEILKQSKSNGQKQAYKLLKKARSKIMPNLGFMNQLRNYEKKILNE